jgi:hypothetical protein
METHILPVNAAVAGEKEGRIMDLWKKVWPYCSPENKWGNTQHAITD